MFAAPGFQILEYQLVTGVVNTTSTPYNVGQWGTTKWRAKALSTLKIAKFVRWCYFQLHISHKTAKSMAKLITQLCSALQLAVSPGEMELFNPYTHISHYSDIFKILHQQCINHYSGLRYTYFCINCYKTKLNKPTEKS